MQRVYRKQHGETAGSDWQRVKVLESICDAVEGVSTPAAWQVDSAAGIIEYDHFAFPTPLIRLVGDDAVFERLGRTFARMHRVDFAPDPNCFRPEPYPLEEFGLSQHDVDLLQTSLGVGWLHGDFWHGNVFSGPNHGFVVVDPIPARLALCPGHIRACGALDVASMCMSLIFCHPLHRQIHLNIDPYARAGEIFTDAYLNAIGLQSSEVVSKAICSLTRAVARRFIDGYAQRLARPVAVAKCHVAERLLRTFDERIGGSG